MSHKESEKIKRSLQHPKSRKDLLFQKQIERAQEAMIADAKAYNVRLRQDAKKPEQLIVNIEAVVTKAEFYSLPDSQRVPTSSWESPMASDISVLTTKLYAEFEILVSNSTAPTKKLLFNNGWPNLFPGDRITAYFFTGEKHYEKDEKTGQPLEPCYNNLNQIIEPPFHWLQRRLREKETAVKIEKRTEKGLAVYHSGHSHQEDSKDSE